MAVRGSAAGLLVGETSRKVCVEAQDRSAEKGFKVYRASRSDYKALGCCGLESQYHEVRVSGLGVQGLHTDFLS